MVRSRATVAFVLSGALVAACGQITGLSDDYMFDLGATSEGGLPGEGGADANRDGTSSSGDVGTGDSSSSSSGSVDSGMQCNATQENLALTSMAGMKNDVCKACLSRQCCMVVQTCTGQAAGCRTTLSCHLDCSEKGNPQQCFNTQCNNSTSSTFQAVRSCATSFCNKECVL